MAYITLNDIKSTMPEKELINLTNDKIAPDSSVDTSILKQVLSLTDEIINGYIRSRYKLPLSSPSPLIKSIAVDIAIYRLYSRRPGKMTETVKTNYDRAIDLLKEIQKGLITLSLEQKPGEQTLINTTSAKCNKTRCDRVFSKENLSSF